MKFTDEQLLEGYNRGLSDGEISKIFDCSKTAVRMRRGKFKLIANFDPPHGKRSSPEEMGEFRNKSMVKAKESLNRRYKEDENVKIKMLKNWKKRYNYDSRKDNERCRNYYNKNKEKRVEKMKEYNIRVKLSEKSPLTKLNTNGGKDER